MDKLTAFADYFRKIPAAFLVALLTVLGLVLFLPNEYAEILAVDTFRIEYRVFIGPAFLLVFAFGAARIFVWLSEAHRQKNISKSAKNYSTT